MMRYFKYLNPYVDLGEATTYMELDADGWTWRQLTLGETGRLSSNVDFDRPDVALTDDMLTEPIASGEITPIAPEAFEEVWAAHLTERQPIWAQVKRAYPVGMRVIGRFKVFFPQRVIVAFSDSVWGVAEYAAYRALIGDALAGTRQAITGIVTGYDEVNQWMVVEIERL